MDLKVYRYLIKIDYRRENYDQALEKINFYLIVDPFNKEVIKIKILVLKKL